MLVSTLQIASHPGLFPELLRTLFEIVLFEECSNQWSLSRPMLALVLINSAVLPDIKVRTGCHCILVRLKHEAVPLMERSLVLMTLYMCTGTQVTLGINKAPAHCCWLLALVHVGTLLQLAQGPWTGRLKARTE